MRSLKKTYLTGHGQCYGDIREMETTNKIRSIKKLLKKAGVFFNIYKSIQYFSFENNNIDHSILNDY